MYNVALKLLRTKDNMVRTIHMRSSLFTLSSLGYQWYVAFELQASSTDIEIE